MTPTPPLWTAETAAAATGGRATGAWTATGVSIDSRSLVPGDLFVALKGPHFDGHRFIPDALAKGAAAVVAEALPEDTPADAPALRVADTQAALEDLGRAARAATRARVIGVTGSAGKTGTKEALRQVLSAQGRTHAPVGSFNNHWGVPLTLARLPREADVAVIEMGMNHAGEIAALTAQARPEVAIITTIGPAHIEFFESEAGIAEAKAEIFQGVPPAGTAILPRDNAHYPLLRARAEAAGLGRVRSFGLHPGADAYAVSVAAEAGGSTVKALIDGQPRAFRVGQPGDHWVANALAVLLAVEAVGAEVPAAAEALAGLSLPEGRGGRESLAFGAGTVTLLDDSYNANPASMRAALSVLAATPARRRLAVLGEMKELGARSAEYHASLVEPVSTAGVDLVFTCGAAMAALRDALPPARRGGHAESAEELAPQVAAALQPGDAVLVKGSAGARTGEIVAALRALGSDRIRLGRPIRESDRNFRELSATQRSNWIASHSGERGRPGGRRSVRGGQR